MIGRTSDKFGFHAPNGRKIGIFQVARNEGGSAESGVVQFRSFEGTILESGTSKKQLLHIGLVESAVFEINVIALDTTQVATVKFATRKLSLPRIAKHASFHF